MPSYQHLDSQLTFFGSLVPNVKCRQLVGSHNVAIETVNLLRDVVDAAKVTSFEGLLEALTQVGQRLQDAGRKGR